MKAILQADGTLALLGPLETRLIRPTHEKYDSLMRLYNTHARVALSAGPVAVAPVVGPTRPRPQAESEHKNPPGYGGHPWKRGTPERDKVYQVPIEDIDAERFQFNTNSDDEVSLSEGAEEAWEPLTVWKSTDLGKTHVLAGHRHLERAARAGQETIPAKYIRARDEAEARTIWATLNGCEETEPAEEGNILDLLDEETPAAPVIDRNELDAVREDVTQLQATAAKLIEDIRAREVQERISRRNSIRRKAASPVGEGQSYPVMAPDLPDGWSIRTHAGALGLFRDGRESPVATAETPEELTARIARAKPRVARTVTASISKPMVEEPRAESERTHRPEPAPEVALSAGALDVSEDVRAEALRALQAQFPLDDDGEAPPRQLSTALVPLPKAEPVQTLVKPGGSSHDRRKARRAAARAAREAEQQRPINLTLNITNPPIGNTINLPAPQPTPISMPVAIHLPPTDVNVTVEQPVTVRKEITITKDSDGKWSGEVKATGE